MSYLIQINEEQRNALLDLIQTSGADEVDQPLEFWEAMLNNLPAHEKETPGCIHGFSL